MLAVGNLTHLFESEGCADECQKLLLCVFLCWMKYYMRLNRIVCLMLLRGTDGLAQLKELAQIGIEQVLRSKGTVLEHA